MTQIRPLAGNHGLDHPAAHLSVAWDGHSDRTLVIRLHLSCMEDGPSEDFEIRFSRPFAFAWEDEVVPVFKLPEDVPHCVDQSRVGWLFPVLEIADSQWAAPFVDKAQAICANSNIRMTHYCLVSLDDLFHVASVDAPTWRWIPGSKA